MKTEKAKRVLDEMVSEQRLSGAERAEGRWWWTHPKPIREAVTAMLDELWKNEMYASENY